MKIMGYNIRHGWGSDGRVDLERIAHVIREADPDAVGVNEVDVCFHRRSNFVNQAETLSRLLDMDAAFAPAISRGGEGSLRQYGNMLLVRKGCLIRHEYEVFSGRGEEPRSLLTAQVRFEDDVWRLAVTHIGFSPWMRRRQIGSLERIARQSSPPLVIMGDFNMGPGHPALASLEACMKDTLAGNREGTYPCWRPRRRIDGIYCSPWVEVKGGWVVETPGCPSDHRPVMAELLSPVRRNEADSV